MDSTSASDRRSIVAQDLEVKMRSCLESDPSGKSIVSIAQKIVYARSALQFLPPSPPMVPSNADIVPASLSLNQQDIRNYIRRLIPSPSPEPTPARGLLTQPSVENLAPIAPIDLVAEEEVEVVWPTDSSSPTRSPRSVSRRIDGIGGLHKINAAPGKASAHPPEKRIIPLDEDGSHAAKKNVISIPVSKPRPSKRQKKTSDPEAENDARGTESIGPEKVKKLIGDEAGTAITGGLVDLQRLKEELKQATR